MKKSLLFAMLLLACTIQTPAQSVGKQVTEASKQSAETKAIQKAAEATDKGLDKGIEAVEGLFKKKQKKPKTKKGDSYEAITPEATEPEETEPEAAGNDEVQLTPMPISESDTTITAFGVYSKFTFVPGNKLIFYDDFAQEEVGDFPANWETGGTGEVVRIPGNDQTWFSLMRRSGYLPIMNYPLPENYTIEFDMMTSGFKQGDGGNFRFVFTNKKTYSAAQLGTNIALAQFSLNHSVITSRGIPIEISNGNGSEDIRTSIGYDYSSITKGITHFSIKVSKQRLQVWLDEEKVVDAPSLLKNDYGRYFLIEAHDVLKEKDQFFIITNFRIAAAPENQRKLFDAGNTFSTTGIYFNTNSAVVKKESYGLLKVIAEAMQAEAASNFEIVGHTDSDGADDLNQQLSERRALAVKNILVGQFGIETGKLTTSGKGETQPVDDNKTLQGKANNRRVEIIKK